MKKIVEWLISMEHMSGELYKDAVDIFKEDAVFAPFLNHLAEDEAWHFHVMGSAAEYFNHGTPRPADIILDDAVKARVEGPFRESRWKIEKGTLTKEALLDCIVTTEFSEWNNLFLYVVNSLKEIRREFAYVASKMEQHKKYIERNFEKIAGNGTRLDSIRSLPKVWNIRMLIVEDYEPLRVLMSDILSTEGLVDTAENGEQGLAKLAEQHYDIVLSDDFMPGMSGVEFYQQAVYQCPLLEEHFLFLMDVIKPGDVVFAREHKIKYLQKPLSVDEIKEAVHDIMSKTPKQRYQRNRPC
jgi:CheY-like chemotaxis protein